MWILMSLLCTSRTLHSATLGSLYHKITIPHSRIFSKFLAHISENPVLGTIVRRLDFCHFNPAQLFSTAAERSQARNLTSETLLRCLELTPNLHEFLAQEYVDDDLDAKVLEKVFLGLPRLQAVDLCGCSSTAFKTAFSTIVTPDWPVELSITRLSAQMPDTSVFHLRGNSTSASKADASRRRWNSYHRCRASFHPDDCEGLPI